MGMEQIDGNICPLCRSKIQLYQINEEESVKLCSNHTCEYPFGHTELEYYDANGALDNSSTECLKWLNSSEFLNGCSGSLDPDFWLDALDDNIQTASESQTKNNDEILFFEKAIITQTADNRDVEDDSHSEIVCPSKSDSSSEVENIFQVKLPKKTYSNLNRIKDPQYVKKLKMINVMYGKNVLK